VTEADLARAREALAAAVPHTDADGLAAVGAVGELGDRGFALTTTCPAA
jgi:hypothetical protein